MFETITSPDANNGSGTNPKAYLTVLFFDERFEYVSEGSMSLRVEELGSMADEQNPEPLEILMARAPKNGYAYVYVSNESDKHVYFDNLQITHTRGRIMEENHYYAYGLRIAAISSKKLGYLAEGSLKNNYLYQGDYSEYDEDIGWHDFALRSYDAQLGRFWQMDPYDEFTSGYVGMGNDPVNMVDPSGGLSMSPIGNVLSQIACPTWGNGLTQLFTTAAKIGSMGSMLNMLTQMHTRTLQAELIAGQLMANVATQAGEDKGDLEYWILYDGTKIRIYYGQYGSTAKSTQVKQYAGTSGGTGYQNSNNQNIPDAGPIPEGDYSINLKPDFTRKAKTNFDGSTKSNPYGGVELLPWGNGILYSEWGQWRARLDKVNVNSIRNDFYFHDSYKGYSHGCIETNTALYYDLSSFKKGGQKTIKVQVKYSPNSSTNGETKQFPPPWWDGQKIQKIDDRDWPKPKPGFPDKTKM